MVYLYKDVKDLIMGFAGVKEVKLCEDVTITKYKCDICRYWRIFGTMKKRDYYTVEENVYNFKYGDYRVYKLFRRFWRLHLCVNCLNVHHNIKGWSRKTTDI